MLKELYETETSSSVWNSMLPIDRLRSANLSIFKSNLVYFEWIIDCSDENGPGCRDIHCTLNPPRHDCVPVFDTNFCCPIKYECGESSLDKYSRSVSPL